MKRRIGTCMYDTGTAKKIVDNGRYYDSHDGDYCHGKLYRKRTGEFFFVTYVSSYPYGTDRYFRFIPLTFDQASRVKVEKDLWGYKDDAKFKEIFSTEGSNQNGKITKTNN